MSQAALSRAPRGAQRGRRRAGVAGLPRRVCKGLGLARSPGSPKLRWAEIHPLKIMSRSGCRGARPSAVRRVRGSTAHCGRGIPSPRRARSLVGTPSASRSRKAVLGRTSSGVRKELRASEKEQMSTERRDARAGCKLSGAGGLVARAAEGEVCNTRGLGNAPSRESATLPLDKGTRRVERVRLGAGNGT